MNTPPEVGKLIPQGENTYRDAIHIAVAPVVAWCRLAPGTHVGFEDDGRVSDVARVKIGVVDPFLIQDVFHNEKFWLFLYPNTVTGLRHAWSHPAFGRLVPTVSKEFIGQEEKNNE